MRLHVHLLHAWESVFRHVVRVNDGHFEKSISPVSFNTWFHITMIYRGPNEGEGFTVYHDGVNNGNDTTKGSYTRNPPSGKVKIGRIFDEPGTTYYGSACVDELLFFNQQLFDSEIITIMNMD